jgi:hypothetical protein
MDGSINWFINIGRLLLFKDFISKIMKLTIRLKQIYQIKSIKSNLFKNWTRIPF